MTRVAFIGLGNMGSGMAASQAKAGREVAAFDLNAEAVARGTGKTPAQVALNWCLSHEAVMAIPKGNSPEHVLENCAASDWRLSREDFTRLSDLIVHRRRGPVDAMIRRCLPSGFKQGLKGIGKLLPPAIRRRLH